MRGLSRPDSFVTTGDRWLVRIAVAIGLACLIPVPGLNGELLNGALIRAIPLPVAVVMLVLPFGLFFGILINQQHKFNDKIIEQKRRKALAKKAKLLFRCRFRGNEHGTVWQVTNANKFHWTGAKLLIERTHGGDTVTERVDIGNVPAKQMTTVSADLVDIQKAQWRVLVISKEGQQVDFPDSWRLTPYEKMNFNDDR